MVGWGRRSRPDVVELGANNTGPWGSSIGQFPDPLTLARAVVVVVVVVAAAAAAAAAAAVVVLVVADAVVVVAAVKLATVVAHQ